MSGSGKKIKVQKGEGLWLLSFSDLSMILISFFILMLAYSKNSATESSKKKDGAQAGKVSDQNNLAELQKKIEEEVRRSGLEAQAKVIYDTDGLSIEFKDGLVFGSGSAQANQNFERVVGPVLNVIATVPKRYQLIFEGHTDDTPIAGPTFRSNWELSASRGITLLQQFRARGVAPDKMSVTAYADTRPKIPIANLSGKALQEARAANRRVVIRIE